MPRARTPDKKGASHRRRDPRSPPTAELGGGLADLAIGAVRKYAPTLRWRSDEERVALIESRLEEGRGFPPAMALILSEVSEETRDALAVWKPLALRHLLSLDVAPTASLIDGRRRHEESLVKFEAWEGIHSSFKSAIEAIHKMSLQTDVRAFANTSATLRHLLALRTTGVRPTDRQLLEEDSRSDKLDVLEQARMVLFGLQADARRARDNASRVRDRTQRELQKDTGASTWTAEHSTVVSRRLTTLIDGLRSAYPPNRWSWTRLVELVIASARDWVRPPCPHLAALDPDAIMERLKKRVRRERTRRESLNLAPDEIYPWLTAGTTSPPATTGDLDPVPISSSAERLPLGHGQPQQRAPTARPRNRRRDGGGSRRSHAPSGRRRT
jgi:hypothetical protein